MNLFNIFFQWLAFLGVFGLHFSSSKSASNATTNNADNRMAVQDGAGLTNSNGNTVEVNSTDAVRAIAGMGTDVIREAGGSVVDLTRAGMDANLKAWDATISNGAALVDKIIDSSTSVGLAAVNSFQPAENKAQDTSLKLGMIAAAAVAATLLMRSKA